MKQQFTEFILRKFTHYLAKKSVWGEAGGGGWTVATLWFSLAFDGARFNWHDDLDY